MYYGPAADARVVSDLPNDVQKHSQNLSSSIPALATAVEFTLTVTPLANETVLAMVERLAAKLKAANASIVNLIAFGSLSAHSFVVAAMQRSFGKVDWPMTWVEGQASEGDWVAGLQVFAFTGRVERIWQDDRVIGSVYEQGEARHCWLGAIGPRDLSQSRAAQAAEAFTEIQAALARADFALGDVIRTWFYNDDLLSWYSDFNLVRNTVYSATPFRTDSTPVSTGISGCNPSGAALTVAVWAVQPLTPTVRIEELASPLQGPAPAYGSSFSRAMEIDSPECRRLLISGTASIAPGGETVWPDDPRQQVNLTMQVVDAILRSRGFGWRDVTRATAYFKHEADGHLFSDWCAKHQLVLPTVSVHCDICREDLLFELEADAWQAKSAGEV
jgi:enamine deaminase RidA (YjgF/YER057c/UK114 family)